MPFAVSAQLNSGSHLVDARINFIGQYLSETKITLHYDIPYSGMVELRIFDKTGKKIFQNQFINEFGENKIYLKLDKFVQGEEYSFQLNYKRDSIRKTLEWNFQSPPDQ